jgi:hypothetical protein
MMRATKKSSAADITLVMTFSSLQTWFMAMMHPCDDGCYKLLVGNATMAIQQNPFNSPPP